jgi:hypothetical protein
MRALINLYNLLILLLQKILFCLNVDHHLSLTAISFLFKKNKPLNLDDMPRLVLQEIISYLDVSDVISISGEACKL